jgi:O-antigen ligase
LAFVIWSCCSSLWAQTKSEAIFENSKLVLGYFIFVTSIYLFKNKEDLFFALLIKFSLFIVFILASVALYQLSTLKNFNKESLYLVTGLNGHKNLFSSFLFLNLFFLLSGSIILNSVWKKLIFVGIGLNVSLLLILQTKAAWLAILLAIICFFGLRLIIHFGPKKKPRPIILIVIGSIVFNVFFLQILNPLINKSISLQVDLLNKNDGNHNKIDIERLLVWQKTYHMIKQNTWKGVGQGNWQIHFPDATLTGLWRAEDLNITFQRPHNDWLWILSETGIIGFNLFLLFILSIICYAFYNLKNKISFVIQLAISFVCGFLIISFFDFPKERIEHIIWFNILLAFIYIKSNNTQKVFYSSNFASKNLIWLVPILLFMVLISFLRLKGEYYTRKMYEVKNTDNLKVIKAAQSALSFVYNIDPTSIPIHWYMANANTQTKDFFNAHINFIKGYENNPFNRNVINDLASSFVMQGDIEKGMRLYKEAARISPRFDDPQLNMAAIYLNQNKFTEANLTLDDIMHDSNRRTNYYEILKIKQENLKTIK